MMNLMLVEALCDAAYPFHLDTAAPSWPEKRNPCGPSCTSCTSLCASASSSSSSASSRQSTSGRGGDEDVSGRCSYMWLSWSVCLPQLWWLDLLMGTFELARGACPPRAVWQYTDTAVPPFVDEIVATVFHFESRRGRSRTAQGDDSSIRPHLEMMTGGAVGGRPTRPALTMHLGFVT